MFSFPDRAIPGSENTQKTDRFATATKEFTLAGRSVSSNVSFYEVGASLIFGGAFEKLRFVRYLSEKVRPSSVMKGVKFNYVH